MSSVSVEGPGFFAKNGVIPMTPPFSAQAGSSDDEAVPVSPNGVLDYEPLEPVHHEPVEGSTERVGFQYHTSFLRFRGEKGVR